MANAREKGLTYIEMAVAVAILMIVLSLGASLFKASFNLSFRADRDSSYYDVRRYVDTLLSCSVTDAKYKDRTGLPLSACVPGTAIPVYDKKGNMIIGGDVGGRITGLKRFGNWNVRAVCYSGVYANRGLNIEVAQAKNSAATNIIYSTDQSDFKKDPDGQAMDWASPALPSSGRYTRGSVYAMQALPCRELFRPSSASTPRCPRNTVAEGFDFVLNRPKCRPLTNMVSSTPCPLGFAVNLRVDASGRMQSDCRPLSPVNVVEAFAPGRLYGGGYQLIHKTPNGSSAPATVNCLVSNPMASPQACACPGNRASDPQVVWRAYLINQWTSPCEAAESSVPRATFGNLFGGLRSPDPAVVAFSQNAIKDAVGAMSESTRHCAGNAYYRYFDRSPQHGFTYGTSFYQCWAEVTP